MKRYSLLVCSCLTLLMACGPSTKIVNSWRDPAVIVDTASLHKFVVAALLRSESARRRAEDKMAALNPGKAVQAYQVLGTTELKESDDFYANKLKGEHYDGIVIMRLVKVDKDTRYVPGAYPTYYGSWRGYYGAAWGGYYDPGYYTTDRSYYVEVNVYSILRDKLVWSGITSTINPVSGDELFDGVIKAVTSKMKEEGFLKS
ncbi:MAG: hypothetical protein ACHQET_04540 [Chitinophagales bacterium]